MDYQNWKVIIFIFSFFTSIIVYSEPGNKDSCEFNKEHTIDLIFVNGYGLGYSVFNSPKSEIRILLDLYGEGRFSKEDGIRDQTDENSTQKSSMERKDNTEYNLLSLTSQYLYKIYENKFGELYLGIGPQLGYSWNNYNYKYENEDYNYKNITYRSTYFLGLSSIIGVRGKLNSTISIFAELEISGKYNWGKVDVNNESKYFDSTINNKDIFKENIDITYWNYNVRYAIIGIRFSI